MAKQTFTTGQVLTAAQMTSLQQTAMGGGSATAKTASYTLVAADAGTTVIMNSASATTITVNTSLFSAGDTVFIQNIGAGISTITAGTATVNTSASLALAQYEGGTLYFTSASASLFFKADGAAAGGSAMVLTKAQSFSASSTVNVNDCFSTTYKNYLILINNTAIAGNFDLNFRLRVSGADNTTSNYNHWGAYYDGGAGNPGLGGASQDKWDIGNSIGVGFYSMWIHAPFESEITGFEATNGSTSRYKIKGGNFSASTSFTGFSLLPTSNDMTGTLRVYGLVDA